MSNSSLVTRHLYFLNLNFRVILAVALFAFVLFAALLLEDDDLFAAAMTDDGCRNGRCSEIRTRTFAYDQGLDIDTIALFGLDARDAKRLTLGNRELFSARSDN